MDRMGEASRLYSHGSELGVYFNDTRYLNTWEMTFNGGALVPLAHELRYSGNTMVFSMTNRDFPEIGGNGRIPRDTFLIRRVLTIQCDILYEIVEIKNFDNRPHELQIEQWAGSKFDDIFEVRGYLRPHRGRMLPPQEFTENNHRITVLQYEGLDQRIRRSYVHRLFACEKIRVSPGLAGYFTRVQIPPKGTVSLKSIVSFDQFAEPQFNGKRFDELSVQDVMTVLLQGTESLPFSSVTIETDNAIVNRAIQNAKTDIYMLLTEEPHTDLYPYAGIPWFSAPFGRDGMITAYQMLPWFPDLAKGVLDYAFRMLGTKADAFTDEQPGKVFHEVRRGEMANTREIPFIPYYGSVDVTPLCLILLNEYIRWTLDVPKLKEWWPYAMRALEWIEMNGALSADGFLGYARQSATGLVNQGWKDSHDSIMHADGKLAVTPIHLCEVQAYVFKAKMGMSSLARLLGYHDLSARLRIEALRLRAQFMEAFWEPQGNFINLALDGDRNPCSVKSSNMGHCLWGEIVSPEHARHVVNHLVSDSMFSGYGIRTLSDLEVAYNPMSYHNGSVWPHDNSLIMEGLRFYGFTAELEKVSVALMNVLENSEDFRLPELFCGFRKRGSAPPIPYEVACKPQAWAAGSVFLMLKSMLGLSMDADQSYVVLKSPILTDRIQSLEVRGLRGRDWEIDMNFKRTPHGTIVDIPRKTGNVRVLTVK